MIGASATALVLALFVYPLLEEIVFRAGLLDWLDRRPRALPRVDNNVIVSIAFGLAHWAVWGGGQATAVVVPSLILGWVWQRWRCLWRCVVLHSMFNVVSWMVRFHA